MIKTKSDPKVKKTLMRNYERKIRPAPSSQVVHDVVESSSRDATKISSYLAKESLLSQPTLCSSDALANYLSDVKKSVPPPLSSEELNVDQGQLCAEMTKKLNFHFNDHIYRNLIELNSSIEHLKINKKDKRPSGITVKKDLEPSIEDFCEDEKEIDWPPKLTVAKPKLRPVKYVEDGSLHRLVAELEIL